MEVLNASERARIKQEAAEALDCSDVLGWRFDWWVRKYQDQDAFLRGEGLEIHIRHNGLLNSGITALLQILCGIGGAPAAYNNANARLYVGDSATAFAASQTDLQGAVLNTNKFAVAMQATYPQVSGQTATWQAAFDGNTANFTWNEFGVLNGAPPVSGSVLLLNRKVANLGTKVVGAVWTLTGTLTLS